MSDTASYVHVFLDEGLVPIVLPFKSKRPVGRDWQTKQRVTRENVDKIYGNGKLYNVGILWGKDSNGACDVDKDSREACIVASYFLPKTFSYGRASKQRSHSVYYSNLFETAAKAAIQYRDLDDSMIVELRIGGGDKAAQSVAPGSVHESGEDVEVDRDGPLEIRRIDGEELQKLVRWIAAAAILAKNFPGEGSRHEGELALGGFLARCCFDEPTARLFADAVAAATLQDLDRAKTRNTAADAVRHFKGGGKVYGFPHLAELFGADVAKKAADWLGFSDQPELNERPSDKSRPNAEAGDDPRPNIRLAAGDTKRIVDEAEDALMKGATWLYQRDNRIVFIGRTPMVAHDGEKFFGQAILERGEYALLQDLALSARFEKFDVRAKDVVTKDPPMSIVMTLRQRIGELRFPILNGIINTPTLRADGSILDKSGYDERTGLFFDPLGVTFPPIPEKPTREDAARALDVLSEPIREFPFVDEQSRAVALSLMITAPVRRALPAAPMHVVDASAAGYGKGKLVDVGSVMATGHKADAVTQGQHEEELEKRLSAKLLVGASFVSIDNCSKPLGGDLLCRILSEERVSPRILGKSKTPTITAGAFMAATGNNIILVGDVTRRAIICRINKAGIERPELREFDFDPVGFAKRHRPELVVAVLTILRAYHCAGRPTRPPTPFGSFEEWSNLVRSALLWLGCKDPCATVESIREKDPQRSSLQLIIHHWREVMGDDPATAAQVVARASMTAGFDQLLYPHFHEALMAVAAKGRALDSLRFANWLSSNVDTVSAGAYFTRAGSDGHTKVALWKLQTAGPPA